LILAPEEQNIYRKRNIEYDSRPRDLIEQSFGLPSDEMTQTVLKSNYM